MNNRKSLWEMDVVVGDTVRSQQQRSLILNELLLLLFFVLCFKLVHYHWKNRNLYTKTAKIPGPFALPIVGSAFSFTGNADSKI